MYYEFYIDVFFVVNLFMDFLVLCLTNRVLQGTARPCRSFLGALAGAFGISLFFWFSKEINTVSILIFSAGISYVMVRLGCGFRRGKELLSGLCACYGMSFLLGGILHVLPPGTGKGILIFFTITFTAYWILNTGIRLFKYLKGKAVPRCQVILETGGQKVELKGLLDTGNCLRDMDTGKPVCVMEKNRFFSILEKKQQEALDKFCRMENAGEEEIRSMNPRYLPYTALGCERGLLPVITADRLEIFFEGRKISVPQPAIGLSGTSLSPYRNFEMIISPKILES